MRRDQLPFALGSIFLGFLIVGSVARIMVGTVDGDAAAAYAASIDAGAVWTQASGYLYGLAGLALAGFVAVLHGDASKDGGRGLPAWGRFAGYAWAASFLLAGILSYASAELAGYQQDPEGAKTTFVLGFLVWANPIATLLGAGFALGVGLGRPPILPAWSRPFSLAMGGAAAAITLLGSVGGIGLLGMAPLAAWTIVTTFLATFRAELASARRA